MTIHHRGFASLLAVVLTISVLFISGWITGTFPFGTISRSIDDLGNQFIPIHTYYWDLLHGEAEGDLFFNWRSGFGTGFYADFITYLSSPFALLVGLFPREQVNLAVYIITLLKLATAGAMMALYLTTWKKGAWLFAGILGASYALCGWALDDASFVTMWLDGLIAFPLLCLVGHWALYRHHLVLGTCLVALVWIANFYTAYMATLGAAIVLFIRMFTEQQTAKERWYTFGYGSGIVTLGIGLAMVAIFPILQATSFAQPTGSKPFEPIPWMHVLSRLLPITEGTSISPSIFVGTPALLLAFSITWQKAVAWRIKLSWLLTSIAILLSFQWEPTQLLWHAFAKPNGSSYRAAFVLCGFLIIIAWLAIHKLNWQSLAISLGCYALLIVFTFRSPLLHPWTLPVGISVAIISICCLSVFCLSQIGKWRRVVSIALTITFAIEAICSAIVVDSVRFTRVTHSPEWGEIHSKVRAQIEKYNTWPTYRTDTGTQRITNNDPWLLGGQGAAYYSSLLTKQTVQTLTAFGFGWDRYGRGMFSLDNEVTDALFAIGARIVADPHQVKTRQNIAAPLVTVHQSLPQTTDNAFHNQEQLLRAKVYEFPTPKVTALSGSAPVKSIVSTYVIRSQKELGTYYLRAMCRPGSTVYVYTPHLYGTIQMAGQQKYQLRGSYRAFRAPMVNLGKTPISGKIDITIQTKNIAYFSKQPIGCLDRNKLLMAVNHLKRTGATSITASGHTIYATLPANSTGTAVLSVPHISGWTCSDGKRQITPTSVMGFIGIPLHAGANTISCSYQTPGFWLGLTLSLLSFIVLLSWRQWKKDE
jgi:uncharacterized membrane protein YfhO